MHALVLTAAAGVLIEVDPAIKAIILDIDKESHDFVIDDLDETHLLIKENMHDLLKQKLADCAGLVALLTDRVDAALLDSAPRLKVVSNYAVGFNNVDVPAATARGVCVGTAPSFCITAPPRPAMRNFSPRMSSTERISRFSQPPICAPVQAAGMQWTPWSRNTSRSCSRPPP